MGTVRGNAMLSWTDSDDITTERVLLLREPFREIRPAHAQSVFPADSLDFTQRQVFTVGEGVDELIVNVRYQDDPQGLLDLIKAGSKKRTITYVPDLDDADRRYACYLIAPLSPTALGMDSDRGTSFGELEVELRLRRTNNTPFADVGRQDRLFSWRAGGRMEEATYSRADVASYAAIGAGGSYGTLTTAASGAARTHWMSTATSRGPRTFQTLLLEEQRTNLVFPSENFASTLWTKTSVSVTSGQADPRGGTNAFLVADATTAAVGILQRNFTISAATRGVCSLFFRQGTSSPASGARLRFVTTAGSTFAGGISATLTWTSGSPSLAFGTQGGVLVQMERWRTGWYRAAMRTTANMTTGIKRVQIIPAIATAQKGNLYILGAQVEQ